MILVNAHQIKKAFGARPLFDQITFGIESGDHIGLIGPNGAGKSTLLKILAGQQSVDEGNLSFARGLKVGFLEQVPSFKVGATILSTVLEGAENPDDWQSLNLAQEYISKLQLDVGGNSADTPITKLSGGWKKRVALCRELVKKPDLLLLDEPTNHLDVGSIRWLEGFLAQANFATLTVTHDRLFLQRVSHRILELDRRNVGGLLMIDGDYAAYLEVKDQMMAAQERRETILKNTLRRETEWLRQGAKARTTKQQARINRAGDLKEEVEEISDRNITRTAKISFQGSERNPKRLIEGKNLSKNYGDRKIFSNVDIVLRPGTRIGLLGPNGCGKSTLIRTLLGMEKPDTGEVIQSDNLSVAYFEQNRETLDPTLSLIKTFCPTGDHVDFQGTRTHIRSYLDRFLFTKDQADMAVGKLSGGEQSRILIAKLMLEKANLLVLDEPTNDLDIATLNILEDVLKEFPGSVLLVTHDRYFLDQVATQILAFNPYNAISDGKLISFSDLNQYESWAIDQESSAKAALKTKTDKKDSGAGAGPKKKRLGFNEQRELDGMEETIQRIEAELEKATAESERPEIMSNSVKLTGISQKMTTLQEQIQELYQRWSELSS
ncbi:MAG: ABC-F family ATP-binding cassette domain-containing protein [Methylotenera sp.]|nr:ABC-F family ATP-binding cassette domain-containing protein [Oligoflexia bacterium]